MSFTATTPSSYNNVVLGLQSTADWSDANYIPGDWREAIMRFWPNGDAPLTAMLAKLPSEVADDYIFNWWTEGLPAQSADLTGVYTDAAMATAYVAASGAAGDVLYLKCSAAHAKEFRGGHTVNLRHTDLANSYAAPHYSADTIAKVLSVTVNGANSCIVVKLLESANDGATYIFDHALVVGSVNPQNSESPDTISYQPVRDYNYMQIFRDALEIAGTTLSQKTRIGDWYQHEKQNTLRLHSIQMEKSFLWGIPYLGVGSNGKPEYTTCGLIRKISTNKYDYATDTAYAGKTWTAAGEDWLIEKLSQLFKYGGDERLAYAGIGVFNAFSKLVRNNAQITVSPGVAEYGIKVMSYMFPFGVIHLKRHPLFSYERVDQFSMVLLEPKNLKYRFMKGRDTSFRPDIMKDKGGWTDRDGIKEGWLTECGLEMHIEPTFGYFTSVGKDNVV